MPRRDPGRVGGDVMDDTRAWSAPPNEVRFFDTSRAGNHPVPGRHDIDGDHPAPIEEGQGRAIDLDPLLDVSDNISVWLGWPPKMTTICPLGPSAVSRSRPPRLLPGRGRCPRRAGPISSEEGRSECLTPSWSRSPSTGRPSGAGRLVADQGRPGQGHLHSQVLLARTDEPGRMCRMCLVEVQGPPARCC